jgi:predicted RNA-binding protein (virulence factor B family)
MESTTIKLGKYANLRVMRLVDFGCYLDGENLGDILLPKRYMADGVQEDDMLDVFIYNDSEDRIIATNEKPYIQVGEFAALKVVAVNRYGAFLDWGLMKDLFVPFFEQQHKMEVGKTYLVFAYVDSESNRIAASSKLDQFLPLNPPSYEQGEEVDIVICCKSEMGYKALINNEHWGLIYINQVFEKINIGDKRKAYIQKMRDDDKIDLSLTKTGGEHIDEVSQVILNVLKDEEFIGLHDKSDANDIREAFGISKKAFKKAIGGLYKKRLISIEEHGIRIL